MTQIKDKPITERAALVLQQINDRAEYGRCSKEELRALRCLKTAIEGLLPNVQNNARQEFALTTLCDQFQKAGIDVDNQSV